MHRLISASSACCWMTWADVDALCVETRTRAVQDDVTGLIVHDGGRFLHIFEGTQAAVLAAFERVRCDRRLQDVTLRDARWIAGRRFHGWDMACEEVSTVEDARSLAARVRRMTAHVPDPELRFHADRFLTPIPATPDLRPAALVANHVSNTVKAVQVPA